MKFDLSAAFRDAIALWRALRDWLLRVAAPFFFLPLFASQMFLRPPASVGQGTGTPDPTAVLQAWSEMLSRAAPWSLAISVFSALGSAVLYALIVKREPTIRDGLRAGLLAWAPMLITAILISIAVAFGLVLLIVPGLYLLGRLFLAELVVVAEGRTNPIDAIRRSFDLTRNHGWVLMFAYLAIFFTGQVAVSVAEMFRQALSGGGENPVTVAIFAAIAAGVGMLIAVAQLLLRVTVYRQLTGSGSHVFK
ncbi:hypothetical protein GCM10023219_30350 [Stakelama sediminis]|uniref:Glycerophosphoryl diester phosphodiesterase membrane domain-containing protein n=1 Tax=Stakelama sediminis TaxID=463200 RepID=A0A840Z2N0_9SPHN|nr:hypothetical protein [Stakelama sediminis]MBB5720059.1 hypothetical protein [Stakelama sediminis]